MTKPAAYRQAIDLARFIASFGVVAAHAYAMENDWVGHISLGLFLILTAFLAMQSAQRAGGRYRFLVRAKRLVLPWLAWSLFFRLVALKVSDDPGKWQLLSDPWSLLVGSTIHLWFLPFVMLAMALVEPVGRLITTPRRLAMALAALVVLSMPLFWAHELELHAPLPQWSFGFPVYILGLLLGVAHPMGRAGWPLLAAAVLSGLGLLISGGAAWALTVVGAVLAFEVFWRMPMQGKWLPLLGQASFGIYLIHPFFMLVTYKFFGAEVNLLFAAVLTFAMSCAAVLVMRRVPALARLI